MNRIHSTFSSWRDYLTPASHTSTFSTTGQVTPEEFVMAGDYLVYRFPTWSWQPADPSKRVNYLPDDKQYLVLKHAPCHSRLDDTFSSWNPGDEDDEGDGWTGGAHEKVKTVDDKGEPEDGDEDGESDDEIPDMVDEEDDDETLIPDDSKKKSGRGVKAPLRTYNLYITYSTYYRVPRCYLSGHDGSSRLPLSPLTLMFEDISPDYRDKTVTIEEFPLLDNNVGMATIHPCRHAETMKRIFESMAKRKARKEAEAAGEQGKPVDAPPREEGKDDWEEITSGDDDGLLRVDQYLVVFLKFLAGVVPGVEIDYTMGM